jgi:uncharacterized protein YdcH (DUF465 family)
MMMGSGFECFFDLADVEALKEGLEEKLVNARRLYNLGYPLNEINDKLDLNMNEVPDEWANEAEDVRVGATQTSSEDSISENADEKSLGDEVADLVEKRIKATTIDNPIEEVYSKIQAEKIPQPVINAFIDDYESAVINPVKNSFTKKLNQYVLKLRKEQLKMFDKVAKTINEADISRLLFSSKKWDKILQETAMPFHEQSYDNSVRRLEKELGSFVKFDPGSKEVSDSLKKTNVAIKGVNKSTQKALRRTLGNGIAKGESNIQLRKRVTDYFKGQLNRVPMIVRTETAIASSNVRQMAMNIEGLKKRWLTSGDELVRDSHVNYGNLAPKGIGYEYAPGLKHPHDTGADAGEVVNCRCVSLPVRK